MYFNWLIALMLAGIGLALLQIPSLSLALGLLPLLVWRGLSLLSAFRVGDSRGTRLGRGALWRIEDSEALYRDPDPSQAWRRWRDKGRTAYPSSALLDRHVLLLGSPGSGKTQMLLLLARERLARQQALIVLDPKSAPKVSEVIRSCAKKAQQAFLIFEPHSGSGEILYDPLQYCVSGPDIADRLMALTPGPENSFSGFCRGVLITLSEGLWLSGERPTLQRLQAHLDDAGERLLQSHASSRFIQDESRQTAIRVALEQLVQHDRTHYQKMTSALMSLLSLLTTGPIGRCLSPDAEEFRPRWDIRRAIDQGVAVYVGLNCLAQPTVGAALARLIMADVAAFSSERLRQANARPLSLMVDEAGEIMSPALLQLLGKGRESSIHVLIAIQTLSDLAWHLGDQAASEVVQGNCGAWFLFRQLDALSREVSERRLGEIPLVEDASHEGMSRRQDGFFTQLTRSRGQSRSRVWRPRIPAALFAGFKDRECVAHFPDGSLWRLTVPLVEG